MAWYLKPELFQYDTPTLVFLSCLVAVCAPVAFSMENRRLMFCLAPPSLALGFLIGKVSGAFLGLLCWIGVWQLHRVRCQAGLKSLFRFKLRSILAFTLVIGVTLAFYFHYLTATPRQLKWAIENKRFSSIQNLLADSKLYVDTRKRKYQPFLDRYNLHSDTHHVIIEGHVVHVYGFNKAWKGFYVELTFKDNKFHRTKGGWTHVDR